MEPNENEIVRLLRYAKELPADLVLYAADCIERLQAHLDERGKYNDWADERIEQLQAELEESQRRERAAVEDILVAHDRGRCAVCKYTRQDGGACKKWPDRSCFEWRGPEQEGDAKDE